MSENNEKPERIKIIGDLVKPDVVIPPELVKDIKDAESSRDKGRS